MPCWPVMARRVVIGFVSKFPSMGFVRPMLIATLIYYIIYTQDEQYKLRVLE